MKGFFKNGKQKKRREVKTKGKERKNEKKGKDPLRSLFPTQSIPAFPFLSCHLRGGLFIDIMQVLKYFSFSALPEVRPPPSSGGCEGSSNPSSHLGLSAEGDAFLRAAPFISRRWPPARRSAARAAPRPAMP